MQTDAGNAGVTAGRTGTSPPVVARLADGTPMTGLADVLRTRAAVSPAAVALEESGRTVTFGELDRRASRVASGLVALGVGPGDRVAFVGRNSAALLEVLYGAGRAGAVPVPLNHRLAAPELADVLADAEPAVLVADADAAAVTADAPLPTSLRRVMATGPAGRGTYEDWRDAMPERDPGLCPGSSDTQLMLYSSGTTGRPKGIELSGSNLAHALRTMQTTMGVDTDTVAVAPIPFFHVAGLGMALLCTLDGGRMLLGDTGGVDELFTTLTTRRVSHAVAVPAVLQALLALPATAGADWGALRSVVYGASPIPLPVLAQATEVFGCDFLQGYGLTESTGGVCALTPGDHRAATGRPELLRSVGRPMDGVALRIVDPTTGVDVPVGARGEVWIAGPWVMNGYWRRPDLTAEAIVEGGWLRSGDGGSIDADGYVWLHDRLKDMVVSGGENVYPAEVESVMSGHPCVGEVAVIGVPSLRWGESPFAFVVARPGVATDEATAAAVLHWTRDRLAHYKVPVGLRWVDALPRNASGKLVKARLRAEFAAPDS